MEQELKIYPNPQWAEDFKQKIKEEYNLSILDASCITGLMVRTVKERMRKGEEWICANCPIETYNIGDPMKGCYRQGCDRINDFRKIVLDYKEE